MKARNRWVVAAISAGLFAAYGVGNAGSGSGQSCVESRDGGGPARNRETAPATELFRLHGIATGRPLAPNPPASSPAAADGQRTHRSRFDSVMIHATWRP